MKSIFIIRLMILSVILAACLIDMAQTVQAQSPAEQELIAAQIKNQNAQADYYEKQKQGKSLWESLEPVLVSAFGTLIGAGLALFGVRWSSNRQWELEERKWSQTKEDENIKDIRVAAATLSQKIAAEIQEIQWLTWIGKFEPETLQIENINSYNQAFKSLMTENVIAQADLIAVDKELHMKMKRLSSEVSRLDSILSSETRKFLKAKNAASRKTAAEGIGNYYDDASALYNDLPVSLGSILEERFGLQS